jgi:hypothetical protein
VFLTQLALVLERYDDKVIEAVTSPATGIQRTCKFPPSIAEMIEFIDEHIRRSTYASRWDERSRKQVEERDEYERAAKTETPEHRKAVVDRIKGELRGHGFQFEGDTKPQQQTWKQFSTDELLARYNRKQPKPEGEP